MREIDIIDALEAKKGAQPSPEFLDGLRSRLIDEAKLSQNESALDQGRMPFDENAEPSVVMELKRKRPGAQGWVSRNVLMVAAVTIAVLGVAAVVFTSQVDDSGRTVATDSERAEDFIQRPPDESTQVDPLESLLEAFPTVTSKAALGAELQRRGLLVTELETGVLGSHGVTLSPDGQSIAYSLPDGQSYVWDASSAEGVAVPGFPLRFTPDGNVHDVTGTRSYSLGDPSKDLAGLPGRPSPDGSRFVFAMANGIAMTDLDGSLRHRDVGFPPIGVRANVDGSLVIVGRPSTGSVPGGIEVWDFSDLLEPAFLVPDHPLAAMGLTDGRQVSFSSSAEVVAVASSNGVLVLDALTYEVQTELPARNVIEVAFTQSGTELVIISETGELSLWNWESGTQLIDPIAGSADGILDRGDFIDHSPQAGRVALINDGGTGVLIIEIDPDNWRDVGCAALQDSPQCE